MGVVPPVIPANYLANNINTWSWPSIPIPPDVYVRHCIDDYIGVYSGDLIRREKIRYATYDHAFVRRCKECCYESACAVRPDLSWPARQERAWTESHTVNEGNLSVCCEVEGVSLLSKSIRDVAIIWGCRYEVYPFSRIYIFDNRVTGDFWIFHKVLQWTRLARLCARCYTHTGSQHIEYANQQSNC